MFSLRSQPKPAISAALEVALKTGTLTVTSHENGVTLSESRFAAYPPMGMAYLRLTDAQADELVAAIHATRAARG
jgi:hypothetical protein